MSKSWKGKQRIRDEGNGANEGIVLPLNVVGSGVYDVAYTIPLRVGANQQNLSLQVDTGSSDLWIASKSCSSSACGRTQGNVYDPSSSTSASKDFSIDYLQGSVDGPVVWDTIEIGGYSIENQAFSAATVVENEALSPLFSGILGLALPLNSIIATLITPTTSDAPDGAAFASNLFSITPVESAPSSRFISLSLSRPDTKNPPALLGIGRHPDELVPDPSAVRYVPLVAERAGTLFWKVNVRGMTVWVNGEEREIDVGRSNNGAVFPTAVVDSGVPLILTTSTIANAIYGAINISPGSDGQYYVPCTTPLNLTVTLEQGVEIPLHPLDLTAHPPQDATSQFCIGLIQSADSVLSVPNNRIGDMILGVPFMRNAYTVMAYTHPNSEGLFNQTTGAAAASIAPRLGFLNLTNPTQALDEFNTIRVLNKPLDGNGSGESNSSARSAAGGKGLSVGIEVLIGLLSFFGLAFALFALRYYMARRKWRVNNDAQARGVFSPEAGFGTGGEEEGRGKGGLFTTLAALGLFGKQKKDVATYELTRRRGSDDTTKVGRGGPLSEDELRKIRYEAYLESQRKEEGFGDSSVTKEFVDGDERERQDIGDDKGLAEFGAYAGSRRRIPTRYSSFGDDSTRVGRDSNIYDDPWDPTTAVDFGGYPSLTAAKRIQSRSTNASLSPERTRGSSKRYEEGEENIGGDAISPPTPTGPEHEHKLSVSTPLLHHRSMSREEHGEITPLASAESVVSPSTNNATAAHEDMRRSGGTLVSPMSQNEGHHEHLQLLGRNRLSGMAGVGTARASAAFDTEFGVLPGHLNSGERSHSTSGRPRVSCQMTGPRPPSTSSR